LTVRVRYRPLTVSFHGNGLDHAFVSCLAAKKIYHASHDAFELNPVFLVCLDLGMQDRGRVDQQ